MSDLRYWHHGAVVTADEMHSQQTPAEIYRDCLARMSGHTSLAEQDRLRRRWPTLGDCNRAMVAAFRAMTDAERATDLEDAESVARWDAGWG